MAESLGRAADLERGQSLLRFLLRTFLLHFGNYNFPKVSPPHLPLSLFTMGLLYPAPGTSDTVWLPWKPPGGEKQPDASDTWRLLIHSQGRSRWNPSWAAGPGPELAGLPLASSNPPEISINMAWKSQAPQMKQKPGAQQRLPACALFPVQFPPVPVRAPSLLSCWVSPRFASLCCHSWPSAPTRPLVYPHLLLCPPLPTPKL